MTCHLCLLYLYLTVPFYNITFEEEKFSSAVLECLCSGILIIWKSTVVLFFFLSQMGYLLEGITYLGRGKEGGAYSSKYGVL